MTDSFLKYLEFEKRYSRHTLISYQTDLKQFSHFLSSIYNIVSPSEADYNNIRAWIIDLVDNEIEARSINRKIACLKSYYKFLMKQGVVEKNPALRIKTPKTKKRLPQFESETSMQHLLEDIEFEDSFTGMRDKIIIELLYGTGMRLSELINLKNSDINIYEATLKVTGKGNKQRIIPVHAKLKQSIAEYNKQKVHTLLNPGQDSYFILTDKGEKAYPMLIQRIVKEKLNLVSSADKKSPHILRHSFATHLLNHGANLNDIKELLGHSNLAATQVYTHNSLEKIKSIFKQAHPKA